MPAARLKTPAQDDARGEFATSTTRQLAGWLESLPKTNADALGPRLHRTLTDLNRSPLRKAARFELLELLRPDINDTCTMLLRPYRGSSLPLEPDDQSTADLVLRLYCELATGYKIVVNEQLDAWERAPNPSNTLALQLGIQRALLCLGRALVESYRIYAPEPPLLWRDVHTLYRISEQARLQGLPIEGTRDSDETALSIKQAYLRIAVLAMANPYHLMQGEAEDLYKRLGRWVHFIQVHPAEPGAELGGRFVLDLDSDFPARYLPRSSKPGPAPRMPRVLGFERLLAALDEQIDQSNERIARTRQSTLSERLQRDMYIRFRDALAGRGERGSERRPTVARLTLVDGLSACHFFANGRRPFTPELDEAEWDARVNGTDGPAGLALIDDSNASSGVQAGIDRNSRFRAFDADQDDIWRKANLVNAGEQADKRQRRTRFRSVPWHRKNESDGGMALFCVQDCPMQVRVGELVCYADDERAKAAEWRIGAVRWLRTRPNGGLELGIKHLVPNAYAVGTKAFMGPGAGAEYLRGLLVPRVNPLTQGASLITPAAVYDVGSVLRLNLQQMVIYVRLTELIETTRLFAHFRFRVVEAPLAARGPAR